MDCNKIQQITDDIRILKSAEFYLLNGWGVISFRNALGLTHPVCGSKCITRHDDDGKPNGGQAMALIEKLNAAIKPVLEEEINILENQLKEVIGEN